jgi:transcriptional antiterminator RfaH
VYLPRYLKIRRHARKVDTVPAPLFPRYLFVAVDATSQPFRSISSTIGIAHLICQGDEPAPIPYAVIASIKEREDPRGFIQLETRPKFAPGAPVRVLNGVFSDCLGLFDGMTDGDRVAVLLDMLGRRVRVAMDAGMIAAA